MRILALDLGTKTGWALADDDLRSSGTLRLATPLEIKTQRGAGLDRCCDVRFNRLQDFVDKQLPLGAIYFEDVEFQSYTFQTQLWAGFRTVISLYTPKVKLLRAIPVGTLKKFATGKGNADKSAMARALLQNKIYEATCPEKFKKGILVCERKSQRPIDDNEADALHLLNYALWELKIH
jgi:hypothetical protein